MNTRQEFGAETSNDSDDNVDLQPLIKKQKMAINEAENKALLGSVVGSNKDSDSSSSPEKWIAEHDELIQRACYEEKAFEELIDKIAGYSDSVEDREILYNKIEDTWDGRNVYGAIVLNNGCFAVSYAEHCD